MNTGWICPRCGKVNSPEIKACDCSYNTYWPYNPSWPYDYPIYPWKPYTITYTYSNTTEDTNG